MEKKEKLQVAGVTINRDDPRVKNAKKIDDIKSLKIFSHLPKEERESAEQELFEKITNPKKEEEAPKPSRLEELRAKNPEDLTEEEAEELEQLEYYRQGLKEN